MLIVCVFVRHSALSQHQWADRSAVFSQAYPECHLISVSTYTPHTHSHTHKCIASSSLQVPNSPLDALCPNNRSWQGERSLPRSFSFSPNPPASAPGLSGSSRLQNNVHCQWEVGESVGLLVFVCRTLHIQPAAELCRLQTQRMKKNLWLWGDNRLRSTLSTSHTNLLGFYALKISVGLLKNEFICNSIDLASLPSSSFPAHFGLL